MGRDEILAAAKRLRGRAMNPHLSLEEWYPVHPGSDSPFQDQQRAFFRDLLAVAEFAMDQSCDHEWGTDGAHSNEFCKRCFVNRPKD